MLLLLLLLPWAAYRLATRAAHADIGWLIGNGYVSSRRTLNESMPIRLIGQLQWVQCQLVHEHRQKAALESTLVPIIIHACKFHYKLLSIVRNTQFFRALISMLDLLSVFSILLPILPPKALIAYFKHVYIVSSQCRRRHLPRTDSCVSGRVVGQDVLPPSGSHVLASLGGW